jgi:hypothetical protein
MLLGWSKTAVLRVEPRWTAFPPENVNFEMQCIVPETGYVHDPDVILNSKTRTNNPTYGYMCIGTHRRAAKRIFTPKNRSQFSDIQTAFLYKILNHETIYNKADFFFFLFYYFYFHCLQL